MAAKDLELAQEGGEEGRLSASGRSTDDRQTTSREDEVADEDDRIRKARGRETEELASEGSHVGELKHAWFLGFSYSSNG